MSLENKVKAVLKDFNEETELTFYDLKSNLYRCSAPLIKGFTGDTYCRHRLILVSAKSFGFVCGLETYEYVCSRNKEAKEKEIVYISKIDTTTTKYKGLTRLVLQSYIMSLNSSTSVFVFARSQPQYLFAKSADNKSKRVLNDRELVLWWLSTMNGVSVESKGWWAIPGIDDEMSALVEIGARKRGWKKSDNIEWNYGISYPVDAKAHEVVPHFDDDAKSRLLNTHKEDMTVLEFWTLLAFGEECGSGKITGFFQLDVLNSDTPTISEKSDQKDDAFTVFWNRLMMLDFHDTKSILTSTEKAISDMKDIFRDLLSFQVCTQGKTIDKAIINDKTTDKRPAINQLGGSFIKRKKV
ncbi:histone acetylation protein-domain-containing protein [Pilobolus umbonatus]|nr:histone acetylation protein-domain-containing protein [Pilobolus umbonatus]